MTEMNGAASDHPEAPPAQVQAVTISGPAGVPMAELIETHEDLTPAPEGPAGLPPGIPVPVELGSARLPLPLPPFHLCRINLAEGCYELTIRPTLPFTTFRGTMRVERARGGTIISGDLYRYLSVVFPFEPVATAERVNPVGPRDAGATPATAAKTSPSAALSTSLGLVAALRRRIPIHPRAKYHSYLKVTNIAQTPEPVLSQDIGPCRLTLTAEEYVYTQPPAGSFNGSFPATPTRTVRLVMQPVPGSPAGSPNFEGTLFEGSTARGQVTMQWVSTRFRRATVEVDTLAGAVAPQGVPSPSGSGTDDIRSAFASAGWDVAVQFDQTNVPVPAGVTATNCWSSADLHALMLAVRKPTTNLDAEWRMHLVVVPAKLGCGRGVMYDQIGVPREGVASFCDDGYPSNESSSFGTAANKRQRDVPRAFLRSACHELGHGFNQIHQEQEGGADNSIMTTTPSVANVLGGPPGVFPTDINVGFNAHVRRHLIHWPDIVVRPGGMTFGSGHSSTVPSADRLYFSSDELALRIAVESDRIELGEPLRIAWSLVNSSTQPIPAPSDVGVAAQHAIIRVTNPQGVQRVVRSFEIRTDDVRIDDLQPGEERSADTRLFWSTDGFAFESPGRFQVEIDVIWAKDNVPLGVRATTEIWVNYPQSDAANDAAATLLHPEVGMYVALGGAPHLAGAIDRLTRIAGRAGDGTEGGSDAAAPRVLRGYAGILPIDLGDRAPIGVG